MNISVLETWFKEHQRVLPFRQHPSAYRIWVSEVMLQQTQMETVLKYYDAFMKRFPDLKSLAHASLQTVLASVQGLGYYRRFRLLHEGAKHVLNHHQGIFPNTYEAVRAIPGIGAYTAGAIMAIAYNQPYPATDGNVIRVLSRLYGMTQNMALASSRKLIDQRHGELVKKSHPREYIQAVMELGALVCRPVNPKCDECPLQHTCIAKQKGLVEVIPKIEKKLKQSTREFVTLLLVNGNRIYLEKSNVELFKDMYLLPQFESSIEEAEAWLTQSGFVPYLLSQPKAFRHTLTHQQWLMDVYEIQLNKTPQIKGEWFAISALSHIPIPEAHKKIIRSRIPKFIG